ncbi:MAG: glycerophosphodiester phosphodiesterase [Ruminococcaceae bacterium]|nr:glycerophosphodiester phosphodiesterase [Oscillospiraceae bacterium]
MEWYFILLIAISATVLLFFALWLFLIAPRARKKAVQPFLRPYAHRGLWGEGIPENSLAAFRAAAARGYAIELDIHLSRDGEVMVFHDAKLKRMCGREGKLRDFTAAELGNMPLGGVETECIPTLRAVLDAVDGRVPLLIELKGESSNVALVPAALKVLEGYTGLWCMESFNPLLLRAVKKQAPHVVRGLLSSDLVKEKHTGSKALNFALSALWLTFLCRPAFHAWDKKYPRRLALLAGIKLFGAASFVYTVKDEELAKEYMAKGTYPIFDNFDPKSF